MNEASKISVSISLVRKELESTLQKAESYFSQFSESMDLSHLKMFADELNLVRGTFKLLELSGAETLSNEMLSLVGDGAVKQETKLEVLSRALISLTQYISILLEKEVDHPILLIPAINHIRKAGGGRPFSEAHFFTINLRPKLPSVEKAQLDIKPHFRRIRLMFQAGLLRVLKNDNPDIGFKLIQRALLLLEKGLRGTMAWPFWWSSTAALNAITEEQYELTLARRMLFSRVDMLMRAMIKNGIKAFSTPLANELHKDFLHLVSLSQSESGVIGEVKKVYAIKANFSESELKEERKILAGPDIGSFDALSKAFKEEIQEVKQSLDYLEKGELSKEHLGVMQERLFNMSNVLKSVNQLTLSERIEKQLHEISGLESRTKEERLIVLASVADALLQVELASNKFGRQTNINAQQEIIGAGHYFEARIVLFDEINTGLSVSKRAIASYVDTHEKLHLANISQALNGVKGALIFLNEAQSVNVVNAAIRFLNEQVLNSEQPAGESKLEILADVLTSIEYYIETVSQSDVAPKDILNLAVQGMSQLNYKVV